MSSWSSVRVTDNHDRSTLRILPPGCPPNIPNPVLGLVRFRFRTYLRFLRDQDEIKSPSSSIISFCSTCADGEQ
jgi:hypothetical protein